MGQKAYEKDIWKLLDEPFKLGHAAHLDDYGRCLPETGNLVTDCARELCGIRTGETGHAIRQVLEKIGTYWEADCAYLFQTEEPAAGMVHEWKAAEHSWEERIEAYMPLFLQDWDCYFINHSFVDIQDIRQIADSRPEAYQMLRALGIDSIIVLPLRTGNHLMGFMGMENYDTQKGLDGFRTMEVIADFVAYALCVDDENSALDCLR